MLPTMARGAPGRLTWGAEAREAPGPHQRIERHGAPFRHRDRIPPRGPGRLGAGGDAIVKTFELSDFVGSVEFVRKLVEPAEDLGHHPDLSISWNKVSVSITNHAAGGLTENDFELARRIDAV